MDLAGLRFKLEVLRSFQRLWLVAGGCRLKKDLAQRFRTDGEGYTEGKTDFIRGALESKASRELICQIHWPYG
jgi:hypothetical protein